MNYDPVHDVSLLRRIARIFRSVIFLRPFHLYKKLTFIGITKRRKLPVHLWYKRYGWRVHTANVLIIRSRENSFVQVELHHGLALHRLLLGLFNPHSIQFIRGPITCR